MRLPSTIRGSARRRSSESTQFSSTDTLAEPVRLGDPLGHGPQRLRAAGAAQEQPCHLGCQVSLAAAALGLLGATPRRIGQRARLHRRDDEHRQSHPVSPLAMSNCPVGGMWKKFQATALSTPVSTPCQRPQ